MDYEKNRRECGACTLCCKVMGIPELDKPAGTWCDHCDKGVGCTIYDERPKPCREFECMWLQDGRKRRPAFDENDRPDKIHVVFFTAPGGAQHRETGELVDMLVATEQHCGAAQSGRARHLIKGLLSRGIPVVLAVDDRIRAVKLTVHGIEIIAEARVSMQGNVTLLMGDSDAISETQL